MVALIEKLALTESPWLYQTTIQRPPLVQLLDDLEANSGFATCVLNGQKMRTFNGVFDEFAKGFKFPDYFGHNCAAFDDCIADLGWLNANGFCVVIEHAEQLFADQVEQAGDLEWLLVALNRAGMAWSEPVEIGSLWDRPAISFHVLFHRVLTSTKDLPPALAGLPNIEQ